MKTAPMEPTSRIGSEVPSGASWPRSGQPGRSDLIRELQSVLLGLGVKEAP
jgi:hypothetical protein